MPEHLLVSAVVDSDILQSRTSGRLHYSKLCEALSRYHRGDTVTLDFSSVTLISASWLNEAIVPLLRWASDERNDLFPLLRNIAPCWMDEFDLVAEWSKVHFLCTNNSIPENSAYLIGDLDERQKATLQSVLNSNGVTGAGMERLRIEEGIKATAWNNRLKDLFERRLVRRRQRGREQLYLPVVDRIEAWPSNKSAAKNA